MTFMPAKRPIRRSQLISPFGIGAMVDFPKDESLMTAGLDAWLDARDDCPVEFLVKEDRLQARLGVTHFRLPPDYQEAASNVQYARQGVPFVRFPRWYYCHHCGGMEFLSMFGGMQRCYGRPYKQQSCASKPQIRRPYLIPVRFVAVCAHGHIQDFPFMEWVHQKQPPGPNCELRLRAGRSSAGLSGITVECSCSQNRSMADVFSFDPEKGGALERIGCRCLGLRPWVGEYQTSNLAQTVMRNIRSADGTSCEQKVVTRACGQFLRVVQRGASNVYFPHVVSSIYLPLWGEAVERKIVKVLEEPETWRILSRGLVNSRIDPIRCEVIAQQRKLDVTELLQAAQLKLDGKPTEAIVRIQTEEQYRHGEYEALGKGRGGEQTELLIKSADLLRYKGLLSRYFSRICLVHKLRETRALAGFTRLLPPDGRLDDIRLQPLKADDRIDWLPAIIVRGEGLFFEFKNDSIEKWLHSSQEIPARIKRLSHIYNENRQRRGQSERPISPKFVLIHTFGHMLINQLSFDCGYGSASLRERIYCDLTGHDHPMQGILIYTASGDSEGTMGGLVRQGLPGRLETTFLRGLQAARWCSSDPVCIESVGQGADNANLAACHGCVLVPETSCEEGNRLLDRAILVGTPDKPEIGFFEALI
jgi:hypothetical protein